MKKLRTLLFSLPFALASLAVADPSTGTGPGLRPIPPEFTASPVSVTPNPESHERRLTDAAHELER